MKFPPENVGYSEQDYTKIITCKPVNAYYFFFLKIKQRVNNLHNRRFIYISNNILTVR